MNTLLDSAIRRNTAWTQLLGLCPLLAVSGTFANALALGLASTGVLVGSNVSIACLRRLIPDFARLPAFVMIIATFTTCTMLLLEAFAFELYLGIALFVQIIVTNCMILARAEAFASRNPPAAAALDALGTGAGFTLALAALGATRELFGHGTLFAGMERLFEFWPRGWTLELPGIDTGLLLVSLPPGAFIVAGLLLGSANAIVNRKASAKTQADARPGADHA